MDPVLARQSVGDDKVLQGNADPSLLYGDPAVIREYVGEMIGKFGTTRYIANLGHGMYPDHNPEHLRAYLEAVVIRFNVRNQSLKKW